MRHSNTRPHYALHSVCLSICPLSSSSLIINFISPTEWQPDTKQASNKKAKQQNKTINCSYILSSVNIYQLIAKLSVCKISEHLAQHTAGWSKVCQELQFVPSNQHYYL